MRTDRGPMCQSQTRTDTSQVPSTTFNCSTATDSLFRGRGFLGQFLYFSFEHESERNSKPHGPDQPKSLEANGWYSYVSVRYENLDCEAEMAAAYGSQYGAADGGYDAGYQANAYPDQNY